MRKLTFSLVALAGLSGSALAADLPARSSAAAPAPLLFASNWTGPYIGVHAGVGWGQHEREILASAVRNDYESRGGLIGLHGGYNWQFGRLVVGLEGEIAWMLIRGSDSGQGGATDRTSLNYGGGLLARAGYLITPDMLLYATGGWAFAKAEHSNRLAALDVFDNNLSGWTLGAGAEYKFRPNWSARLEYRYADYGRFTNAVPGNTANPYRVDTTAHVARIGVTYHFGGPAAAVMARY